MWTGPLNCQKVLERLPSTVGSQGIARHLDGALLRRLEVRRFGEGTKKNPRGKKIPAGQSYSAESDEEQVDDEEEQEEADDDSDGEEGYVAVVYEDSPHHDI